MRVRFLRWTGVAGGVGAGVAAFTVALAACGGGDSGVSNSKLPAGARSEVIQHEPCPESGAKVTLLDANGDGKPDIRRVADNGTGKEVCRVTDLNYDGRPDMFQYFDKNGQLRRREADYDGDGVVEALEYYENGKLVRRELDISGQHRLDTWDFFDASEKRIKRERDTDGDGRVDQWWTWSGDQVTIAFDKNNDGQPDPNDTMTLNASGAAVTTSATLDAGAGDAGPPLSTAAALGAGVDAGAASKPVNPQGADTQLLNAAGAKDGGAPKDAGKGGGKK
ncbi:hypothetical protein LZC95_17590 [Pendulispora brunnea]|uniref:Lipoprotein n=1 Tax=Pendulispora brunnea TaxID=2905690 RepID=A0ABZ2KLU9_9BACT